MFLFRLIKFLFGPLLMLLFRVKTVGRENIPKTGRALMVANHSAIFDPVIVAAASSRTFRPMAKKEAFNSKIGSWFLTSVGCFPVNRYSVDTGALLTAEKLLNQEEMVILFSEGTRSKTKKMLPFKTGAAALCYKTESPVIPVGIITEGNGLRLFKRTVIRFGEPITKEKLFPDDEKDYRQATNVLQQTVGDLIDMGDPRCTK